MGTTYRVERVMSNNAVLVTDTASGSELILLGKGIGFGKITTLDSQDARIDKKFRMDDEAQRKQFQTLLGDIAPEVFDISEEIISMMERDISANLNEHVHVALPSHIHFALYRLRNGMDIDNPFLYETRTLFPKEYEVAAKAAELIGATFGIQIPEDEIGFLAYHVHSAIAHVPVGQLVKSTTLITEIVEIIERRRAIHIPKNSLDYARLIIHLRFAIERVKQKKTVKNPFVEGMKQLYREEYELASEIGAMLADRLQMHVPEDEVGYIMMHLYRLFQEFAHTDGTP
ncbi:transcription antiterminator BglG [Paenibacillus swuensis]|uniref:Transcription antiterminator BglG n=1 Tax=Paenibacillus swuensis TaxID=1178515 RepID=A0A172TIA8_9BACL|nr:PRD domain-containing protein [Paenibacillus swuensis]ANE46634.1 transcription antiterminator BglG [Paenibacillus swuensis]